ncbi:hypothetical protein HDU79_010446, partial [Rhizoclosmatium sp. JEL0117]
MHFELKQYTEIAAVSQVLQTLLTKPISESPQASIEESFGTLKMQQESAEVQDFINRVSGSSSGCPPSMSFAAKKTPFARSSKSGPSGPSGRKRKHTDYEFSPRPAKRIRVEDCLSASGTIFEDRLRLTPHPYQRTLASSVSKSFSSCVLEIALRDGLRFLRQHEDIIIEDYLDIFNNSFKKRNSAELLETSTVLRLELLDFIGILNVMQAGLLKFSYLGDAEKVSETLGTIFYAHNMDAHAASGGLTDLQLNHIMDSVFEFLNTTGCDATVWGEYDALKVK